MEHFSKTLTRKPRHPPATPGTPAQTTSSGNPTALNRTSSPSQPDRKAPALQRDTCPLCFPVDGKAGTEDYVLCVALDGNNSLKRRDRPGLAYQEHSSRFRLPPELVNRFSNQTITAQAQRTTTKRPRTQTTQPSAEPLGPCASHWTAAKARPRANMRFSEMGWFPLVCRHGVVLAYADLIKEYEQSKFPLALAHWFATQYSGRITFGYDIGCQFQKTFRHAPAVSHLLGPDPHNSRINFRESHADTVLPIILYINILTATLLFLQRLVHGMATHTTDPVRSSATHDSMLKPAWRTSKHARGCSHIQTA